MGGGKKVGGQEFIKTDMRYGEGDHLRVYKWTGGIGASGLSPCKAGFTWE